MGREGAFATDSKLKIMLQLDKLYEKDFRLVRILLFKVEILNACICITLIWLLFIINEIWLIAMLALEAQKQSATARSQSVHV